MSPSLFFDNKEYISAKEASFITGYSNDYVGQLARSHKIDSKRISRIWYVRKDAILNYKKFLNQSGLPASSESSPDKIKLSEIKKIQPVKITEASAVSDKKVSSMARNSVLFISIFLLITGIFSLSSNNFSNALKNISSNFLSAALIKSTASPTANYDSLTAAYKNYLSPISTINLSDLTSSYKNYLALPTVVKITPLPAPTTSMINISNLISAFKTYLTSAIATKIITPPIIVKTVPTKTITLRGPAGPSGPQGPTGPQGGAGNSLDPATFVLRTFFDGQVNRIFDSISNSTGGLSNALSQEVDTKLLAVSGNATVGGDLTVTGNSILTGNLNVSGALNATTLNGAVITGTGTLSLATGKNLTVLDNTTLDTNSLTLAGGEVITFSPTNALSFLTTGATSVTLPTSGTLVSTDQTTPQTIGVTGARLTKLWATNLEITNLPTINDGTLATALGLGSNAYTSTAYLPLSGGTMTGGIINSTSINPLTTLAESWIGPSSTAGVYFKDGNVGIGTTAPHYPLEVAGDAHVSGTLKLHPNDLFTDGTPNYPFNIVATPAFVTPASNLLDFYVSNGSVGYSATEALRQTRVMTLTGAGNVGIGTTGPGSKLDVRALGTNDPLVNLALTGAWTAGGSNTDHGMLITGPRYAFDTNTSLLNITNTDGTPLFRVTEYGNVGIGTTNPAAKLHIAGSGGASIFISDTTNDTYPSVKKSGAIKCPYNAQNCPKTNDSA